MKCPNHPMIEMLVARRNGPHIIFFCPQCNTTKVVHKDELYKQ